MPPAKGSKRVVKERQSLDFGAITVSRVTDRSIMAQMRRTKDARDPEQVQVDTIVEAGYKAWIEAGKPANWADMPGTYLAVPHPAIDFPLYNEVEKKDDKGNVVKKDGKPVMVRQLTECQVNTLRWRVVRAGAFYEIKIRFGDVKIEEDDDGNVYAEVVFAALDRPPASTSSGEPDDDEDESEDEESDD